LGYKQQHLQSKLFELMFSLWGSCM